MKWSAAVFLLAALCLSQAKYVRFKDLKNIKVSGGAVTFKPEPEVKETVENTRDKLLEWDVALQTLNTSLVNWNDVIKDLVRPNFVDFAILLEHLQVSPEVVNSLEDNLVKIERNIQNAENVSWDDIETVHNNIRILSEFIQEPRERLVDLPQLCKYTTVFAEDLDKTVRMHHGHISSSVLVIDNRRASSHRQQQEDTGSGRDRDAARSAARQPTRRNVKNRELIFGVQGRRENCIEGAQTAANRPPTRPLTL